MTQDFAHFTFRNGKGNLPKLFCEDADVDLIAKKQGTPAYVYSYNALIQQFQKLQAAFANVDHLICYAVKANTNAAIMKSFFSLGAGADVVSGWELRRALKAGCEAEKIVFSGVGKTSEEIHLALQDEIYQFNVESEHELLNIERIATFLDRRARVAIRVNPDIDAKTHPYISTGLNDSKFGVSEAEAFTLFVKAKAMTHVDVQGIACHIGSQITDMRPFADMAKKIRGLVQELKRQNIILKTIDVGGGLGIRYHNEANKTAEDYAQAILPELSDLGCRLILEPGRFLTGNAGVLLTKVIGIKKGASHHFTVVDAAFNDLMRPMLYGAYHEILPVVQKNERQKLVTNVVGPVCESTDCFAKERTLQASIPGEYLAIMSAGAYGMSMASTYNSRGRPSEILVKDKEFYIIKKPDRLEDITQREALPEFLKDRG